MKLIGTPPPSYFSYLRDQHTGTTSRVRANGCILNHFLQLWACARMCTCSLPFCRAIDWIMGRCAGSWNHCWLFVFDRPGLCWWCSAVHQWHRFVGYHSTAVWDWGQHHGPSYIMDQNKAPEYCLRSTSLISWHRWGTHGSRTEFYLLGLWNVIGLTYSNMVKLDNSRLSLATKLCIYNCCIWAVLLYGSETWSGRYSKEIARPCRHVTCAVNVSYWAYPGLTVLLMLKYLLSLAYQTSNRSSHEDGMLSSAT